MQGYAHLAQEERYHIEALRKEGRSMRSIAAGMGRCHSTVSRELRRNAGQRGYRHQQADRKARERLKAKPKCVRMTPEAAAFVDARLSDGWSPEQVSGRMKAEGMPAVSHEAIYRRIWLDKANGGGLHRFLRHSHRKRRKRYGKNDFRGRIPCRTDISERPSVVDERSRLGDWEADTVIGKGHRGALVTLAERKTRFMLAHPVRRKTKLETANALLHLLSPIAQWVRTITYDNGREFSDHVRVARALACEDYFATPYRSCERGTNENGNGLLRQYFPKTMPLSQVRPEQVRSAIDKLNNRPRKCLDYRTPKEAFRDAILDEGSVALMG